MPWKPAKHSYPAFCLLRALLERKVNVMALDDELAADYAVECCDKLVMLPTHGVKNSLNVATACSVLLWEALRQWDE